MQAELARDPSIPSQSRPRSEESSAAHVAVAAAAAAEAAAVAVPPTQAPPDSAQANPLMPPSNDVTAPHSALPSGDAAGQAQAQAQAHINVQPPAAVATVRSDLAGPLQPISLESATVTLSAWAQSRMIFSDLYKTGKLPLTKLRSPPPQPLPTNGPEYDADLVSRDKTKQKEAVKKYLSATIRSDWAFTWPPVAQSPEDSHVHADTRHPGDNTVKTHEGEESREHPSSGDEDLEVDDIESADDTASVYSTVSDDPAHFKVRAEWTSDLSDDDVDERESPSAYRFDSPDAVGSVIKSSGLEKRAKRRKAVREEESWNGGLACFNARRDAWTSAKTARVKPKPPVTPVSPATRRLSFWRLSSSTPPVSPTNNGASHISPLSPTSTHHSGDSTAVASSSDADSNKIVATRCDSSSYPVEILLPIPPPLLPPANPMRASITPATYPSIYDRIVVHSMTPACPVNLGDVLRACVAGWKRDGEWPPRSTEAPTSVVAIKKKKRESNASHASTARRMSLGFLGRRESANAAHSNNATTGTQHDANGNHEDGAGTGKALRRSIQKVLGLGHERRSSAAGTNGVAT